MSKKPYKCEICDVPTNRWKRCDDHYKCDKCRSEENLCSYVDGVRCDMCFAKEVLKRIDNFKGATPRLRGSPD